MQYSQTWTEIKVILLPGASLQPATANTSKYFSPGLRSSLLEAKSAPTDSLAGFTGVELEQVPERMQIG